MLGSSEFGNENMIRSFKYRIYPNKEQARLLYNLLLEKSIEAYKKEGKDILGYKLNTLALRLRKEKGFTIYAQSTQEIGRREINACGDETAMIEKAITSYVKETGNLEMASNCQFQEY